MAKKDKAKKSKIDVTEYIDDVFVTEKGKPYLAYITEEEGDIEFASITGKGIKLNPKNKYMSYKVSMTVPKSEADRINAIAQALWDEYKPKGAPKKPANELVYFNDKDEKYYINPHCQTKDAEDNDVVIGIVDSQLNKLDPDVFGKMGKGSTGHLNVNFTTYEEGVSMYLNGVQLIEHVAYAGGKGDGTGGFKAKEGKSLDGVGKKGFSKKKDKEKKKKKDK